MLCNPGVDAYDARWGQAAQEVTMRRATVSFLISASIALLGLGCGPTGTGSGSGGASGGGSGGRGGGGGIDNSPDAMSCGMQDFTLQRLPPDLLIVQDKSGSMNDPPS